MNRTGTVRVTLADGSERTVALQFEEDEWTRLAQARAEVVRVDLSGIIAGGRWNTQFTLKWEEGKGLSGTRSGPSDEDVAVVLHRLRPFLLQNERLNFNAIVNVIKRRGEDDEFRAIMDGLKRQFTGGDNQRVYALQVNGEMVNSEAMLQTYLNAIEFHRDPDKQAKIAALQQLLPDDTVRGIMVSLLVDKLHAVGGLGYLLDLLFGERATVFVRERGTTLAMPTPS